MKNYTTKIESKKTIGEITELLTENYAKSIQLVNDDDRTTKAIKFSLVIEDKEIFFLLEANVDATLRAMVANSKVTKAHKNKEQAIRTAWRNLKEYLQIKLAFIAVESEKNARMLDMKKHFFADMVDSNNQTIFQAYQKQQLQLAQ